LERKYRYKHQQQAHRQQDQEGVCEPGPLLLLVGIRILEPYPQTW
jgi:hypothetical protein